MRTSLLPSLRAKCGLPTPLILQLVPGEWTLPLAQPLGLAELGTPMAVCTGLGDRVVMRFREGGQGLGTAHALASSSTVGREQPGPGLAILGGLRGWEQPQSRWTPILWSQLGEGHLREHKFAFCASLTQ